MILRAKFLLAAVLCLAAEQAVAQARIVDVVTVRGVRGNHLFGYGLVVGLNGTGDSLRESPFTQQSLQSMFDKMGVNVRNVPMRSRNVAAVMVMAELPASTGRGSRIDVNVSSLGDASSLAGGSLLLTPLTGADNLIYAVAQGPITVGGTTAVGKSETVTQGVPTAGRVTNGALVERNAPDGLPHGDTIELELRNPDFATAVRIVDAVNAYGSRRFGHRIAAERDMRSVVLRRPASVSPARFLAEIGELRIEPDAPARVVIDERTGTVVVGRDVQISTVAVAHGSVVVRVSETPMVSQPNAFSAGRTVVASETAIDIREKGGALHLVRGTKLETLVSGLNRIGLKPSGVIAVLQAIKSAGALQAELVTQ